MKNFASKFNEIHSPCHNFVFFLFFFFLPCRDHVGRRVILYYQTTSSAIYEVFFSSVVLVSLLFSASGAGIGASGCFEPKMSLKMVVKMSLSSVTMPVHASCHDAMLTLPKGARGNEMIHSA